MASTRKSQQIKKIFGMNMRLERTRQGMSQEKLGECVGRGQGYISQVEGGRVGPSLEFVGRVADALGVRPVDLLDESLGRKSA